MAKAVFQEKIPSEDLSSLFLEHLKKEHNFSQQKINSFIGKREPESSVPLFILQNRQLSSFEAIVKYLHENQLLTFSKIAQATNRDQRTIWASYHHAQKKLPGRFVILASEYSVPLHAISSRRLSVLESIVDYLISDLGLAPASVAVLINRDPRTIHTVKKRIGKKMHDE
jgi:hypothetical protein